MGLPVKGEKPLGADFEACFDESLDVHKGMPGKLACDGDLLQRWFKQAVEAPLMPQFKGGRLHAVLLRPNDVQCTGAMQPPLDTMVLVGAPALALRQMREPVGGATAGSSTGSAAAVAAVTAAGTANAPAAPPRDPPEGRPSCLRNRHRFRSNHSEAFDEVADPNTVLGEL